MRSLVKPSVTYNLNTTTFINDFIQERRTGVFKSFLLANQVNWTTEVINYNAVLASNNILNIPTLVNFIAYKKKFKNQYNSAEGAHSFIKTLREAHIGSLCPYCGSPACGTLDHYYPKMTFPQYAITPDNLIPCCYKCNKIKDEIYPITNFARIINPYFDNFLNNFIFELDFYLVHGVLDFTLLPNNRLTNTQRNIVEYHIHKLNLQVFHAEAILAEFDNVRIDVNEWQNNGVSDSQIRNILTSTVTTAVAKNKVHDWTWIIKHSIINNQSIYDLL
jgi:hypothetical protein